MIGNSYINPYGIPIVPIPVPVQDTGHIAENSEQIFQHLTPVWTNIKNQFKTFQNQLQSHFQTPYQEQYHNQFQNQFHNPVFTPNPEEAFMNFHDPSQQEFGLKFAHGGLFAGHNFHHPFKKIRTKAKKLKGAALSALTLLAFLFFLHVLQTCLKEHMDSANPTVIVSTVGGARETAQDADDYTYDYPDENEQVQSTDYEDYETKTKNRKKSTEKITLANKLMKNSSFHKNPLT